MKRLLTLIFIFACATSLAQDERFFRDFFIPERAREKVKEIFKENTFHRTTPLYEFDLTGDGRNEAMFYEKLNGLDYFHIHNYKRERVFTLKLDKKGWKANLYKLHVISLSNRVKGVILYYYEGYREYLNFRGTSRVYMVTLEDGNLKTLKGSQGPSIWIENKDFKERYYQRAYFVTYPDLNKDGTKELVVTYNKINRVYMYLGKGDWHTF